MFEAKEKLLALYGENKIMSLASTIYAMDRKSLPMSLFILPGGGHTGTAQRVPQYQYES